MRLVHFWKKCRKLPPTEQKVFSRLNDYMRTWTEDVGRPRFVKDKIWQMLQSSDTKTLKLTKYFEELLDKARQNWLAGSGQTLVKFWKKVEDEV